MDNLAIDIIRDQISKSHTYFMQTLEGIDDKVAQFQPPGTANPIAGTWAHMVFTEDGTINAMIQKKQPLFESDWKDKTGASELQPNDWVNEYPNWLRSVKIDVPTFIKYTQAVFEDTEEYLKKLMDNDLESTITVSWEPEPRKLYDILNLFIISHINNIMGEISVLKGIQGLKGYPF